MEWWNHTHYISKNLVAAQFLMPQLKNLIAGAGGPRLRISGKAWLGTPWLVQHRPCPNTAV